MYNLASGWLMMGLNADPFIVSMVQVANTLPLFLFAIPAGALVDVVDRRRFLIYGESAITIMSVAFCGARGAAPDHPGQPPFLQLHRERGFGHDGSRLTSRGAAARPEVTAPNQCQPCDRACAAVAASILAGASWVVALGRNRHPAWAAGPAPIT
jgi:MFS family permease